jgi:hypothetical protein
MAEITRNPRPLFVTSLPTGYDGQEVFFQSTTAGTGGGASNSMADVGAVWHLRYRAASSSAYKWEFVGGGDLIAGVATSESTTSATYTDLATVGPVITLPLAGDYKIATTATVVNSSAGSGGAVSFSVSGAAANTATDADSIRITTVSVTVLQASSVSVSKTGLTAAAVTMRYRLTVSGTATFTSRVLTAVPIRVG